MTQIDPKEIRYIKLGRGGCWAPLSVEKGEIHFGYRMVAHDLCSRGNWNAVAQILSTHRRSVGKVQDGVREVRDFYTLGADCLWITFVDGHLYWSFAHPEVVWLGESEEHGARKRCTVHGWRKTNILGQPLSVGRLSTRLTQLAAYRGTICRVKSAEYLIRRINGVEEPVVRKAHEARSVMIALVQEMIRGLHWADFETLVDLIFARAGWQRTSRVGEDQNDVDIVLHQPTTRETAFVQIKSKANQAVLNDYLSRFERDGTFDRFFFVCHTPRGRLVVPTDKRLHLWVNDALADAVVRAGLFDWLVERSA